MAKIKVTTSGQVERVFIVEATDEEHAKKRFTTYKHDPEAFAPGIVVEEASDKDAGLSTQRITSTEAVEEPKEKKPRVAAERPRVVRDAGVAPAAAQAS